MTDERLQEAKAVVIAGESLSHLLSREEILQFINLLLQADQESKAKRDEIKILDGSRTFFRNAYKACSSDRDALKARIAELERDLETALQDRFGR